MKITIEQPAEHLFSVVGYRWDYIYITSTHQEFHNAFGSDCLVVEAVDRIKKWCLEEGIKLRYVRLRPEAIQTDEGFKPIMEYEFHMLKEDFLKMRLSIL